MYASQLHRNLYDPFSAWPAIPSRRPDIKNTRKIFCLAYSFWPSLALLPSGRHPLNTDVPLPLETISRLYLEPCFPLPSKLLPAERFEAVIVLLRKALPSQLPQRGPFSVSLLSSISLFFSVSRSRIDHIFFVFHKVKNQTFRKSSTTRLLFEQQL